MDSKTGMAACTKGQTCICLNMRITTDGIHWKNGTAAPEQHSKTEQTAHVDEHGNVLGVRAPFYNNAPRLHTQQKRQVVWFRHTTIAHQR